MNNDEKILDLILEAVHDLKENTDKRFDRSDEQTNKRLDILEKKMDKTFAEMISKKDCSLNQTNLKSNVEKKIKEDRLISDELNIQKVIAISGICGTLAVIISKFIN